LKSSKESFIGKYAFDATKLEAERIVRAIDAVSGQSVALKFTAIADSNDIKTYATNFRTIQQINHPNIICHIDFFELEPGDFRDYTVVEVLEYANHGTFADYLKKPRRFSEIIELFKQILYGFNTLHQEGILHRDVKATNVLLTYDGKHMTPKISDIELFRPSDANSLKTTPEYLAPEVTSYTNYTIKSELWAIGVMVYELFTGKYPFGSRLEGIPCKEHMRIGCRNSQHFKIDTDSIPEPFRKIVNATLVIDPLSRVDSVAPLLRLLSFGSVFKLMLKQRFKL
jgi:serine/threonine protein kinase